RRARSLVLLSAISCGYCDCWASSRQPAALFPRSPGCVDDGFREEINPSDLLACFRPRPRLRSVPPRWNMASQRIFPGADGMGAWFVRAIIFGGLMTSIVAGFAGAQTTPRPPIGDFGSPPDAMIFYVAHGAAGACGQGCSEWVAAEGTVQWDTHKRLIAILDRQG